MVNKNLKRNLRTNQKLLRQIEKNKVVISKLRRKGLIDKATFERLKAGSSRAKKNQTMLNRKIKKILVRRKK